MMTSDRVYDSRCRLAVLGLTGLLLGATSAHAQFQLVTNFEDGMGETTLENTIPAGNSVASVVEDPFPAVQIVGNHVLTYQAGTIANNAARLVTPIPVIEEGTTGTVFFRFAVDDATGAFDAAWAVSPKEIPLGHADNAVLLVTNSAGQLRYYDGAVPGYTTVSETRQNKTWYNAWMVIDTEANSSSLYLQGGTEFAEQTLVAEDYAFRPSGADGSMQNLVFLAVVGTGAQPNNGTVYVDDIHVDPAAENLTTPQLPLPTVAFNRARGAIVVDGDLDANRYTSVPGLISRVAAGAVVPAPEDVHAHIYGAWSDDGLYLFFDVTDDVFNSDEAFGGSHRDDSIELYFDPNNSDNPANFDGYDDFKLVIHPQPDGTTVIAPAGFPTPYTGLAALLEGATAAHKVTDTGWTAEAFIPSAAFKDIDPYAGVEMGFNVQINDDDGVDVSDPADGIGDKESTVTFSGQGTPNFHTNLYGGLLLRGEKHIQVPVITASITVDGIREDAYNASWKHQTDGRWLNTSNPPADTSAEFYTLIDAENLYLFFSIADETLVNDSGTSSWLDDGLELFIDGNNNKGGNFDNVDDIKFNFRPLQDGTLEWGVSGFPASPAGTTAEGVEAVHTTSEAGWTLEVKIPVSKFKFTVEPGAAFGFDVAINDDDDGEGRDGTLTWAGATELNNATNFYGTAYVFGPNEAEVHQVETAPTVDGNIDEIYGDNWNYAERAGGNTVQVIGSNARVWWTGVYDSEAFYLFFDVIDDSLSIESETAIYQDDSLEIFFDPMNNSTGQGSGEDVKVVIYPRPGNQTEVGTGFPTAGKDVSAVVASTKTSRYGWVAEVKVPFSTLGGMSPADGAVIGFDIQFNDDDDGGNRDHYITWSGIASLNLNAQQWGNVTLVGGDAPSASFAEAIGATDDGEGWFSSWFGAFYEVEGLEGWIYHEGFEWIYVGNVEGTDSGFWFYSNGQAEWAFAEESIFPNVYFEGLEWASYYLDDETGAWIWHYSDSEWHPLP